MGLLIILHQQVLQCEELLLLELTQRYFRLFVLDAGEVQGLTQADLILLQDL